MLFPPLLHFDFCFYLLFVCFKGLNRPRWKLWASFLTLCRPLTWLKVEIWWLFLKFPIIWTLFLCVLEQNLPSCCGVWEWCFHRLLSNWEPPKSPHTPVTQTACDVLSHQAQRSLSWEWEQPSHNQLCTAASTSPGSREGYGCTQKESTRTPLSLLPLMLSPSTLLQFLQAPTVVSRCSKAFVFPPPASAGEPRNSCVRGQSPKVASIHQSGIKFQSAHQPPGWLPIPTLPENKTVNAEPFSVPAYSEQSLLQGGGVQAKLER